MSGSPSRARGLTAALEVQRASCRGHGTSHTMRQRYALMTRCTSLVANTAIIPMDEASMLEVYFTRALWQLCNQEQCFTGGQSHFSLRATTAVASSAAASSLAIASSMASSPPYTFVVASCSTHVRIWPLAVVLGTYRWPLHRLTSAHGHPSAPFSCPESKLVAPTRTSTFSTCRCGAISYLPSFPLSSRLPAQLVSTRARAPMASRGRPRSASCRPLQLAHALGYTLSVWSTISCTCSIMWTSLSQEISPQGTRT